MSFRKLGLVLLCLLSQDILSQKKYKYNSPGSACYAEFQIVKARTVLKAGTLVIGTGTRSPEEYVSQCNLLESGLFDQFDFLFVQLLNSTEADSHACKNTIARYCDAPSDNTFFVSSNRDLGGEALTIITCAAGYSLSYSGNLAEETIRDTLMAWNRRNAELSQKKTRTAPKQMPIVPGLHVELINTGRSDLGLNRKAVLLVGLSVSARLSEQISCSAFAGISINKPSRESIKSSAGSQVYQAWSRGDSLARIHIDVEGHLVFQAGASLKYTFRHGKNFRPFMTIGGGYSKIDVYRATYTDSLDLTGGLSVLRNQAASKSEQTRITKNKNLYFNGSLELGFGQQLNQSLQMNFYVPLRAYIQPEKITMFTWGLGVSLQYHFNK